MKYNRNGVWQNYWGEMPLPQGSESIGTIQRDGELTAGALIKLENGNYVQGNAGSIRNLPKPEVERLIAISAAAAAIGTLGGSAKSDAKTQAVRENGKRGGRPIKPTQSGS